MVKVPLPPLLIREGIVPTTMHVQPNLLEGNPYE